MKIFQSIENNPLNKLIKMLLDFDNLDNIEEKRLELEIAKIDKEINELEGILFKNNDKSEEFYVKTKFNKITGKKERYYPYTFKSDVYKKYEEDESNKNQ